MATRLIEPRTKDDTKAAVRVRDLRRAFGDKVVLEHLDLTIAPGELVAVLGRSGSGKSTLLRTLAGLDPVQHGDVDVPGSDPPQTVRWQGTWAPGLIALGGNEESPLHLAMARDAASATEVVDRLKRGF